MLDFYHPEMQQCLLDLAVASGAELLRPAEVLEVCPGDPPTATVRVDGATRQLTCRLVVGADGRNSRVRTQAGFTVERDQDWITIAGALYRDLRVPDDAVQMVVNPIDQGLSIVFPIGGGRFRAYVAYLAAAHPSLAGARDVGRFVDMSVAVGGAADWFRGGECIGPLASFNAPDCWAPRPYRSGVVLIGDAAAASDPVWGSGLSLTLRDVRVLRIAWWRHLTGVPRPTLTPRSTTATSVRCTAFMQCGASCSLVSATMRPHCANAPCLASARIRRG